MGKKPIVSVTYENETISINNSLPYLKCVLRLSSVVHAPIYGRFMGFYVNGFLSFYKSARGPYRRDVIHILSKVCCFFLKSFHFRRLQKRQVFFPYKSLYCKCYATMPMLADAHISSQGYLWLYEPGFKGFRTQNSGVGRGLISQAKWF